MKEFYPTRKDDMLEWPLETEACQFKLAIGDLGMLFRPNRESFNIDLINLVPDENLKAMYRQTLEDMYPGKKFIGVAWTGGVLRTMRWYRSCDLQDLWPLGQSDTPSSWGTTSSGSRRSRSITTTTTPWLLCVPWMRS